jgi:16S rRNA (uracil1498-N3)-methyltransferase
MRDVRVYSPEALAGDAEVMLAPGPSEHLLRVLRLRPGERFTAFDGSGGEYPAELRGVDGRRAIARLGAHVPVEREAPLDLTLVQALLRAEKMDWIVQKATELGVRRVVPVEVARSVVHLDDRRAQRRAGRWREIAIGACEQCGRNRVPEILEPAPLASALSWLAGVAPVPSSRVVLERGASRSLAALARAAVAPATGAGGAGAHPSLALLIGPEGGLDPTELAAAAAAGFEAVHLGPRVLRAETAALAALATIHAAIDAAQ